jgi:integrase
MNIIDIYFQKAFWLSNGSKSTYKSVLKQYFKTIKKKPQEIYLKQKQEDYELDITTYFNYLISKKSYSIISKIRAVKSFLDLNKIYLDKTFYNKIFKSQSTRPITIDKVPNKQIIKEMLIHSNAKEKALILIAVTTGMRIGEILNLTLSEIDLKGTEPYTIYISPETKTKAPRTTFTTEETKQAIEQWKKVRTQYLKSKKFKGSHLKGHEINPIKSDKLFPFKYETARTILENIIKKTGYKDKDPHTKRYQYHWHSFRKYFKTTISTEIPPDIAEALIGHEEYLKEIYNRYTTEQIQEYYKQAIPKLNLYEAPIDTTEITNEQKYQQKMIQTLMNENEKLKDQMKNLSKFIKSQTLQDLTYKEYENRLSSDYHKYINNQRIDYKWNKDFTKLEPVDKKTQKEFNKCYKNEIKYELEYEKIEKENPNLTPPEIDKLIEEKEKNKPKKKTISKKQ